MSRTTFFGFGAFVGSIRGLTECAWWDDDPVAVYGFSQPALVPVDLAKNPSAARAETIGWDEIQVDDHQQDGGRTTIGPMFPTGGVIGACWLDEQYWESLPNKPPRQPASAPDDAYDYELTTYQYYDDEQGNRRFYGYHARVTSVNGPLSEVEIWNPGTGKVGQPVGTWWLDLRNDALPVGVGTTIGPVGSTGALFLQSVTASTIALREPKKPPLWGENALPVRSR